MRNPLIWFVIALLALAGVWLWLQAPAPQLTSVDLHQVAPAETSTPAEVETAREATGERVELKQVAPEPTAADPPNTDSAAPETYPLTGLCLDTFDNPLAGVEFKVAIQSVRDGAKLNETRLIETNARGVFRLDLPRAQASQSILFDGTKACYTTRSGHMTINTRPDVIDVGVLRFFAAGTVRGIVLDASGRPVPKAALDFVPVAAKTDEPERAALRQMATDNAGPLALAPGDFGMLNTTWIDHTIMHTEVDGSFGPFAFAEGPWQLTAKAPGFDQCEALTFEVVPGGINELTLTCTGRPPITGHVIGDFVPGEKIAVIATGPTQPGTQTGFRTGADLGRAMIQKDGSFLMNPSARFGDEVSLELDSTAPYDLAEPVKAAWGDDVTLVAVAKPSLRLRIVDALTNAPIPQGFVSVSLDEQPGQARPIVLDADGVFALRGLGRQPYNVYVTTPLGYRATGPHTLTPRAEPYTLFLQPDNGVEVHLVDATGAPVVNANVLFIGARTTAFDPLLGHVGLTRKGQFMLPGRPICFAEGLTDSGGTAFVPPPELTDWFLFVMAADKSGATAFVPWTQDQRRVELRLSTVAPLTVDLHGAWPLSELSLHLVEAGPLDGRKPIRRQAEIDPLASTATFTGLDARVWHLGVRLSGLLMDVRTIETDGLTPVRVALDAADLIVPRQVVRVELADGVTGVDVDGLFVLEGTVPFGLEFFPPKSVFIDHGTLNLPALPRQRYVLKSDTLRGELDLSQGPMERVTLDEP